MYLYCAALELLCDYSKSKSWLLVTHTLPFQNTQRDSANHTKTSTRCCKTNYERRAWDVSVSVCLALFKEGRRNPLMMLPAIWTRLLTEAATKSALYCISVGRLEAVSWRVDYTLSSSELREINEPVIQLKLQIQGAESGCTDTTVVSVSADKFRVLLAGQHFILSSHNLLKLFPK